MVQSGHGAEDRIVVGYFADGLNAYRAVTELIDEGFNASEIGAAFRARRAVAARLKSNAETGGIEELAERNPATSGSIGGPASGDEAVQPAGLAPGSGNAFPAPVGPGPIPGSEIPSSLPRDLPSQLPSQGEEWRRGMKQIFGENAEGSSRKSGNASSRFGTGEGHIFAGGAYSEAEFENSFVGLGVGAPDAQILSAELSRGGAVVSVSPSDRASLAEAIIQRNHGRVRFDVPPERGAACEDPSVEVYGRMCSYYRQDSDLQRRKAS